MLNTRFTWRALAGTALLLVATAPAGAQTDTTRRPTATSDQRIPVRKDQNLAATRTTRTTREAAGEVALRPSRLDSLEAREAIYVARIDSLTATTAGLTTRLDATEKMIAALQDSLNATRTELASARADLTATRAEVSALTARTNAIGDSLTQLNRAFRRFKSGPLFGNSGFYVGVGSGGNFTMGALHDDGYGRGGNVAFPIGWNKRGKMLGFRGELALQTFEGRAVGGFTNPDPGLNSVVAMLALHFPFNQARTHNVYVMGGGGAYKFKDIGTESALNEHVGPVAGGLLKSSSVTKAGITGGVGAEFHILGATSLFAETRLTNVFAEKGTVAASSGSLRWVPVTIGLQFR
ncbi:MAG: hypothetical protein ACT4P7_21395 [Gemmatimonadaceae bacterium]